MGHRFAGAAGGVHRASVGAHGHLFGVSERFARARDVFTGARAAVVADAVGPGELSTRRIDRVVGDHAFAGGRVERGVVRAYGDAVGVNEQFAAFRFATGPARPVRADAALECDLAFGRYREV